MEKSGEHEAAKSGTGMQVEAGPEKGLAPGEVGDKEGESLRRANGSLKVIH
jgi:hypothetical protein